MDDNVKQYLTPDQVMQLNEKHGYFQFADAQGNVSQDFAQDAIAMHEAVRAAAPDLLGALKALHRNGHLIAFTSDTQEDIAIKRAAVAAIKKATGAKP